MKSKYLLLVIFFISLVNLLHSQITPFETVVDDKKTVYKTNMHDFYNTKFENQPYSLIERLRQDLKIIDDINLLYINNCIQNNQLLQQSKFLFIDYVVNENGHVLSCSLIDYRNKPSTISPSEIECILDNAMKDHFSFSKMPNGVSEFYSRIRKRYMFHEQNKLKIEKSENTRLIKVLNNSELIGENTVDFLSVRIYKIDNGTGSAGFPSSEVSHNLLIAVSEFDEVPNQNLFEIGPFYNPKFMKWTKKMEYQREFEIEYGAYDDRKLLKLKVNINELKME